MSSWSFVFEQGRYLPVVVDTRSGAHKLLSVRSISRTEVIERFQALGPCTEHYEQRITMRTHAEDKPDVPVKLPPTLTVV